MEKYTYEYIFLLSTHFVTTDLSCFKFLCLLFEVLYKPLQNTAWHVYSFVLGVFSAHTKVKGPVLLHCVLTTSSPSRIPSDIWMVDNIFYSKLHTNYIQTQNKQISYKPLTNLPPTPDFIDFSQLGIIQQDKKRSNYKSHETLPFQDLIVFAPVEITMVNYFCIL